MERDVDNREWVRVHGDRADRLLYHSVTRSMKEGAFNERRRLGLAFSECPAPINREAGFGSLDISHTPEYAAAAAECAEIIQAKEGADLLSKGSLDFIANGKRDFGPESACVALATSPLLLGPVTQYFGGVLPVLFGIGINRAKADEMVAGSSHYFHLDPEDTTQIKAFIRLGEVEAARAFYALPANLTDVVVHDIDGYGVGRIEDDRIDRTVGSDKLFCGAGPAGHVIFCDTNRCLHAGGRPGRLVRDTLTIHYALPTSTWFPRTNGDGSRRILLQRLERIGDEFRDALFGWYAM